MDEAIQCHLAVLGDEVSAAAIPSAAKQTALWCLEKLPALYIDFCKTNESRYIEEITRLVQAVLQELVNDKKPGPEVQLLAKEIPARLRLLHEQLGLPGLILKTPRTSTPHSRKVG